MHAGTPRPIGSRDISQALSQIISHLYQNTLCIILHQRFYSCKKWPFLNELEPNLLEKLLSFFSRRLPFQQKGGEGI